MFEKVLVGVDGRPGGRDAIALAKKLVASSGRLVLVNAYGGGWLGRGSGLVIADERARARELLTRARQEETVSAETCLIYSWSPSKGLHRLAEYEQADLLVVGSTHRGEISQELLGNDTIKSLNGSPCAVAIAPSGYASRPEGIKEIGVGYDGSAEGELALAAARDLAKPTGANIHVYSIVTLQTLPESDTVAHDWMAATEDAISRERSALAHIEGVIPEAMYGDPAEELARVATQLDLLIVGSRAEGAFGRLMDGSTSNYLARRCPCPLLVTPRPVSETGSAAPGGSSRDLPAAAVPTS